MVAAQIELVRADQPSFNLAAADALFGSTGMVEADPEVSFRNKALHVGQASAEHLLGSFSEHTSGVRLAVEDFSYTALDIVLRSRSHPFESAYDTVKLFGRTADQVLAVFGRGPWHLPL